MGKPGDACGKHLGDGKSRFLDLPVDRAGPMITDGLAMSWGRLGVTILVMFWGSLGMPAGSIWEMEKAGFRTCRLTGPGQ